MTQFFLYYYIYQYSKEDIFKLHIIFIYCLHFVIYYFKVDNIKVKRDIYEGKVTCNFSSLFLSGELL